MIEPELEMMFTASRWWYLALTDDDLEEIKRELGGADAGA